jgi:hypothetical protein
MVMDALFGCDPRQILQKKKETKRVSLRKQKQKRKISNISQNCRSFLSESCDVLLTVRTNSLFSEDSGLCGEW